MEPSIRDYVNQEIELIVSDNSKLKTENTALRTKLFIATKALRCAATAIKKYADSPVGDDYFANALKLCEQLEHE